MGRTKNKSMKWQVQSILQSKLCIGQSKHEAKKEAKKEGKSNPDGIYSWGTYNDYKKHCVFLQNGVKIHMAARLLKRLNLIYKSI